MGGADGGEGGGFWGEAQGGNEIPGLQSALGVGDEVQLFTACLRQNVLSPAEEGPGVAGDAAPGVLAAEMDRGPMGAENVRHPAPVGEDPVVPAVEAVDEQKGIPGPAVRHEGASFPFFCMVQYSTGMEKKKAPVWKDCLLPMKGLTFPPMPVIIRESARGALFACGFCNEMYERGTRIL